MKWRTKALREKVGTGFSLIARRQQGTAGRGRFDKIAFRPVWLLAGAALLAAPASSQQSPESLLPPGFGESPSQPQPQQPQPAPSGTRPSGTSGAPAAPAAPGAPAPAPGQLPDLEGVDVENISDAELQAMLGQAQPEARHDMPDWARRSPDNVGPLTPLN